jgi:hypothetical protein
VGLVENWTKIMRKSRDQGQAKVLMRQNYNSEKLWTVCRSYKTDKHVSVNGKSGDGWKKSLIEKEADMGRRWIHKLHLVNSQLQVQRNLTILRVWCLDFHEILSPPVSFTISPIIMLRFLCLVKEKKNFYETLNKQTKKAGRPTLPKCLEKNKDTV